MSNKKAKEMVSDIMAVLTPAVLQEWGHDPALKKEAVAAIRYTEKAMVEIMGDLFAKRFQKAADAAHDFAPFFGSVGAQRLLDMIAGLKHPLLDQVRPSFVWASGRAHYDAGDLSSARTRLIRARRQAISQHQASIAARIAIDLGSWAYDSGDYHTAKHWYEKAKEEAIAVRDAEIEALTLHNLALEGIVVDAATALKLLKKSLALKEAAGSSEESKAASWTNIGILYANAGNHEQAHEIFERVVNTYESSSDSPHLALGLLNLGNSATELGRFGEAKQLYQKGLALAERWGDLNALLLLHQGYASSAFKHGAYDIAAKEFRALHQLRNALDDNYGAAIALHDLSLSLARKGNKKEARKTIDSALKGFEVLNDKDWCRRCLLLIASDIEDRPSESKLDALQKAADMTGGRDLSLKQAAHRTLWHELIARGRFKEATVLLKKESILLKNDPTQLKTRLHHAGMILLEKGRKKEALRLLKQVEKLTDGGETPEVASVRQDLSIVFAENGRNSEAFDLLDRNIALARRNNDRVLLATSLGNLGEIKSRAGLQEEAVSYLGEAARLSRELHDIEGEVLWLNNLSIALSDLGKDSEAEQTLKVALKISKSAETIPEMSRILGSLGNLTTKNGRFEESIDHYTTAIEAAEKTGSHDFAISMRFNRAYSHYHSRNLKAALEDAKKVVVDAFKLGRFDLATQATYTAAYWAIEGRRPAAAGAFVALNFLSNFMVEQCRFDIAGALLLISRNNFSEKRYLQFYHAIRRQLLRSDETGTIWKLVEQTEKKIHTMPGPKNRCSL